MAQLTEKDIRRVVREEMATVSPALAKAIRDRVASDIKDSSRRL